ncbi:hypothetical protein [Methanosarcina horonobensis]|uniref:hypothetical protein n=1 Tax=Methanosarcina horonobensis TaxID=418008 RepID=UPI000AB21F32|nr:hypothetical protein [Methanosarcina horonobensis]
MKIISSTGRKKIFRAFHFLSGKKLGELGKCKLIQPDLDRMFELDPEVVENLSSSSYVFEAIAYFHPPMISLCQELAKKGS